jgi:hypothetical protein
LALSDSARDATLAALHSFVLDAKDTAEIVPSHISLFDAHLRLGHRNYDDILEWSRLGLLRQEGLVLSDKKRSWCHRCHEANPKKPSIPSISAHRPTQPLHTMEFDLFGRTRIAGVGKKGGIFYFNVGYDRATTFLFSKGLTFKDEAAADSQGIISFEQRQLGVHCKVFQTDGGGEYQGPLLRQFLFDNGTFHRVSAPYRSDQAGGVERRIGMLEALTRVQLSGCTLATRYFPYAWNYSNLLINVLRSSSLPSGGSAYVLFRGRRVNLQWFRPFGVRAYVMILPKYVREHKLSGNQAALCYFVGLDEFQNCFLFIHAETERLIRSVYARFEPIDPATLSALDSESAALRESWLPDSSALPVEVVAPSPPAVVDAVEEFPAWGVPDNPSRDSGPDMEPSLSPAELPVVVPILPAAPVAIAHVPPIASVLPSFSGLVLAPAVPVEPISVASVPVPIPVAPVPVASSFSGASPPVPSVPVDRRSSRIRTPAVQFNIASTGGQSYAAIAEDSVESGGGVFYDSSDMSLVLSTLSPLQQGVGHAIAAVAARRSKNGFDIPRSFKAATTGPDATKWIAANGEELANHERNGTFEEVYVVSSVWLLGSMWVYDVKHDGRFKARLVALGNQMRHRDGDPESSSPTAGQMEFRAVVAISTEMQWPMFVYDVTSAYLYGVVPEAVKIFMRLPQGYTAKLPAKEGFVIALRLRKGLYGVTFAGRLWHDDFAANLLEHHYQRDASAPCIFYIIVPGHSQLLVLFVDDFGLSLECEADREAIERTVFAKYQWTGGAPLTRFVGIEVERTAQHTTLTQTSYILSKVEQFSQYLHGSCPPTPALDTVTLTKAMCPVVDSSEAHVMATLPYRELVGSLLFAAISTRPDISKAVSNLSRYLNAPGRPHWKAAVYCLHYLKGTSHLGIRFTASGRRSMRALRLSALVDASFAPHWKEGDGRSVTGFFLRLAHGPLFWDTHLQDTSSISTAESEFHAFTTCGQTTVWAMHVLTAIGCTQDSVDVFEDNTAAISMIKRPLLTRRTKHITVKAAWLRELVAAGTIVVIHCPTDQQLADALTKCQGRLLFLAQRGYYMGYLIWIPPSSAALANRFDVDYDAEGSVEEARN